jgi:hypothetical protein
MGHMVQGITGIPYYYRQFGYEYALDLDGSRTVYFAAIPQLKPGEGEPYSLRDATPEDLSIVQALYNRERAGALVSTRIDERYWRFMIAHDRRESGEGWRTQLILDAGDRPRGYVLTRLTRWADAIAVCGLAVEPGIALVAVLPTVLRALRAQADSLLSTKPDMPSPTNIRFTLGRAHPVYAALGDSLATKYQPPYAWYIRVPDLPGFIRHIAPVLEARLSISAMAGYSGGTRLDFYQGGLRLAFEGGRLEAAEDWRAAVWGPRPQGGFPPLVFLQLLFGHRSLDELRHAFPDVRSNDEAAALLNALFPAQLSWVLPLE